MAFKPKNLIVKNQPEKSVQEKKQIPSESSKVDEISNIHVVIDGKIFQMKNKSIEHFDKYNFDNDKVYLVVNGKAKEISPKSKYMLDMLIIEEE